MSDLILPGARLTSPPPPNRVPVTAVTDWEQLQRLIDGLTPQDAIIDCASVYGLPYGVRRQLLEQVLTSRSILSTIVHSHLPPPTGISRVGALAYSGRLWSRYLREGRFVPSRGLDFVWVACTPQGVFPGVITPSTVVRPIHSLDYDLMLTSPPPQIKRPYVLLLDAGGNDQFDGASLQMERLFTEGEWEALIALALDRWDALGVKVLIARHPRSVPPTHAVYTGHTVVMGGAPALLRHSAYALTLNPSSVLGIATATGTPTAFLAEGVEALPRFVQRQVRGVRRCLGIPVIPASRLPSAEQPPRVNEHKYVQYSQRFVKVPGTSQRDFWSVVAHDLRESWRLPKVHRFGSGSRASI
ncbi:MAG: hypothetical protein KGP10_09430 [Actinomycetales bacterium]|nr:hypothetical protein [Actinomycetales bacterium]